MQIAQLFFHNSILIASRTADFWCFLKELAGLHRILIGFCDLFRKILLKREKAARINQKTAQKQAARFFRLPAWGCLSHQRRFSCFCLWCQWIECQRCTASIEKRKINKNQSENCTKTGSTISFACLLGDVWAVKGFFHVSFYDASESSRQPLQSKSECQQPTLSSSSCLPISCCPSSPSTPSPEIGQSLSGKTTAAAESSY